MKIYISINLSISSKILNWFVIFWKHYMILNNYFAYDMKFYIFIWKNSISCYNDNWIVCDWINIDWFFNKMCAKKYLHVRFATMLILLKLSRNIFETVFNNMFFYFKRKTTFSSFYKYFSFCNNEINSIIK